MAHAVTFAEVAVMTLLDGQAHAGAVAVDDGLAEAMDGRVELFQAQGMVMVQLGVSISDALARMRAYAYAENGTLAEVARDIVARRLRLDRDQP